MTVASGHHAEAMLPNFLVIGAQKAGTTALYYYLKNHPDIFMSSVKEPEYFAWAGLNDIADRHGPGDPGQIKTPTLEAYLHLFRSAKGCRAVGEASTIYLHNELAPEKIKKLLPNAKLIAILRDPAERAYSNFLHLLRDGREPLNDFRVALREEAKRREQGWSSNWRYAEKGFYARPIARYLELFGSNLRVHLHDDFEADPQAVLSDLYRFLGVNDGFTQDTDLRLNAAGIPRSRRLQEFLQKQERLKWVLDPLISSRLKRRLLGLQSRNLSRPTIPPEVRRDLIGRYREDVEQLERLIQRDLTAWTRV